ncbi:hypothetical protein [Clostridium sp. C8-1-8]|uniref:hypothetical protein n=1 Tax=Clostridium sp. C8-1-8 TaxID=2698831 RepID=UPI00136AB433|nr:hypothetical protein [Clostridium sp. C8-1-8]
MKGLNAANKRVVVGGGTFTDSLIRNTASTEEYVEYVISLINNYLFSGKDIVDYLMDSENLYLYHGEDEILNLSQKYIDSFRQSGILAFDKFIIEILSANGFELNKRNNYYDKLRKASM